MDPSLRLKLAPERRLAMTFALRQALSILQMPQIELAQWLAQEIEKNPLLEEISGPKKIAPADDAPAPVSLYARLIEQIRESFSIKAHQDIAEMLLEHLDEKGFLSSSLNELSHLLRKPLYLLESILETLQTFDPPGIFARNLQESLLLQLKAKGLASSPSYTLIRDSFDDLLYGRYASIKKRFGAIDLAAAFQELARLRLRPASVYSLEIVPTASPDLQISQSGSSWTIEALDGDLPKFQIHPEYENLSPEAPEEKETLRSWMVAAKWLFRSLKRRRQILIDIAAFLVRRQAAFLSNKGPLRPLSAQELAARLELHESTLSRALAGKYAATPRGIIPLRALLSAAPETDEAKEALKKLILQEDKKKPLTDDQLSRQLQAAGFSLARRTVAKYRKELKIGSASSRQNLT